MNVNNAPTVSYTRGNDLSGSLEGAGGIGGLLARSSGYSGGNWTTHNFYFADGNGNITYMENSSQSMVASYRYDPFGNTISSSGTLASANVYRFSSKEIHANSGMYYYGFRFYDPNLQRWINRDPIGERGFRTLPRASAPLERDVVITLSGQNCRKSANRNASEPKFAIHERGLYLFLGNNAPNMYDPLGLLVFTLYGNYCGPGWCDGKKQSEETCAKCPRALLKAPTDAMDACCKQHDLYIGVGGDTKKADKRICDCLQNVDPENIIPAPGYTEIQVHTIWSAMMETFCNIKPHQWP